MQCSNCGKDIPYAGKVCPFCHVDKSKDQQLHASAIGGGFAGLIIGAMFGVGPAIVLAILGVVAGFVACKIYQGT
jgi:outer membrane lipoprotein SlyB